MAKKKETKVVEIPSITDAEVRSKDKVTKEIETDERWVDDEQESMNKNSDSKLEKSDNRSIYDIMEEDIMAADLSDAEKAKRLSYLMKIRNRQVNLMLVGATLN